MTYADFLLEELKILHGPNAKLNPTTVITARTADRAAENYARYLLENKQE